MRKQLPIALAVALVTWLLVTFAGANPAKPCDKPNPPPHCEPSPTDTPTTPPPTSTNTPPPDPGPDPSGPGGGVFSVSCDFDHEAKDDPIVFHGQSGASHLHQFFGGLGIDENTTVDDLVGGPTSCDHPADAAGYWVPALVSNDGTVFHPTNMLAYYQAGHAVRPFPPGLVMVVDASSSPKSGFGCGDNDVQSKTPSGVSCSSGYIKAHLHFAYWWDGRLDSPDHRSHLSFTRDATHTIELVHLHIHVQYRGLTNGNGYHLAPNNDGTIPMFHGDFMNGWAPGVLETIVEECVNAGVDCKKDTNIGL